ncbi:MAG: response regulator [Kofleriaceae bacterium]
MGERVLIVEDEAIIAEDIRRTLVQLGYDVPPAAATGAEAVALAETLRPRLILMDIKLKGEMDGIEAAALIRDRFGTPVVYLTSHSDEATLARAKETQPYGYILKPFEDRDLRIAIEVALRKHELESLLAERERWFATTLESIGDAVIAIDAHDVITFLNPVAERVTGWGRAEAVGKKLMDVLRLVDDAGLRLDLSRAPRDGFAAAVPAHAGLVPKSGANIPVDNTASPIVDDRGNVLGQVVVFRDITERRQLEQRLAISERMAAIGTMAAGMSHEINNPLAYVLANVAIGVEATDELERGLERVKAAGAPSSELDGLLRSVIDLRAALSDAHEGAERVRKIVHDLKKFTRAEDPKPTVLDLPDVLDAAIKMIAHQVRHHAQLRKEYGTTPFVEASEGPLVQLFTNLLVNAAQAIDEGNADTELIRVVTYSDDAGRAVVEVHDTGTGISKEHLRRLFDPFFTTKPIGAGMGLGLSISHAVVAGLGGEITVESEVGRGSMFRVTLPAATTKRGVETERAHDAPLLQRRGRVLVVDDDASVARSVARTLKSAHDVVVETDARAALTRLTSGETFDVIFCDLMMPNMTGMDLYEELAAVSPELARRMVFLTGGTFSPRATQFIDSVANLTESKPFSPERLRSIAKDYVR